ncbi:hypothetical protein GCM10007092_01270 [Thermus composti]|uniref:Cell division protein FtsL n=1 Tax=Thermus composti TaxID=532059 RepID=A0ABV6PZF3_9DEIN|nr:hypothetical protein [Thermus composti]GGM92034.1 hypothetical protein GCM10007092_01270 [Thermus composti]
MRVALRFGLLYLLSLLLLFALGHRNQMEKAALARLEDRLAQVQQQEADLLKQAYALGRPHRILEWARKEGFIPMSEGRWAP